MIDKYPIIVTFNDRTEIKPLQFLKQAEVSLLDRLKKSFDPLLILDSIHIFLMDKGCLGLSATFKYDDIDKVTLDYYNIMQNICNDYPSDSISGIPVMFAGYRYGSENVCRTLNVSVFIHYINICVELPESISDIFYDSMKEQLVKMCWNSAKELMRINEIAVKNINAMNRDVLEEIRNYQYLDIDNGIIAIGGN